MEKPVIILSIADYRTNEQLHLRELGLELDGLKQALQSAEKAGLIEIVDFAEATVQKITQAFLEYENRVVAFHYAGHADAYDLLLEDNADGAELASFLGRQRSLRFVFLNGCSTYGHVEDLHNNGVPAVIATACAIEDAIARELAVQFYTQLAGGRSLETSFNAYETLHRIRKTPKAELYTRGSGFEEDGFPWKLYIKPGADAIQAWNLPSAAGNPLFGLPEPVENFDLPVHPFRYLHPYGRAEWAVFFGRGREIRALYEDLNNPGLRPVMLVYGQSGVGKSSLLEAGLLPRLENECEVRYVRRDASLGLRRTMAAAFGEPDMTPEAVQTAWKAVEQTSGRRLIFILDQVEEALTRSNITRELEDFFEAVRTIFLDTRQRPQGKLALVFRKEWLSDIRNGIKEHTIPFSEISLERLSREGVIEVVNGLTSTERLREQYNARIDSGLAEAVAENLCADPTSPIAPMLRLLMARMWDEAYTGDSSSPHLSLDCFHSFRRKGLGLDVFLEDKLKDIASWNKDVIENGLVLDVLNFFTTSSGTGNSHPLETVINRYGAERAGLVQSLLTRLCDNYLLLCLPAQDARTDAARYTLAHDTLAPVIRHFVEISTAAGQIASRIIESSEIDKKADAWAKDPDSFRLNAEQLRLVQNGLSGTRALTPAETKWLNDSRTALGLRARNRRIIRLALFGLAILAFLGMVAAFFFERRARHRAEAEQLRYQAQTLLADDPTAASRLLQTSLQHYKNSQTLDDLYKLYSTELVYTEASRETEGTLTAAAVAPDGAHLALVIRKQNGYIVKGYDSTFLAKQWATPGSDLPYLSFTADSRRLMAGGSARQLLYCSTDGLNPYIGSDSLRTDIACLAASPDCRHAAIGFKNQPYVEIWDLSAGRMERRIPTQSVHSLTFYTERFVMAVQADGSVLCCNIQTGRATPWLPATGAPLQCLSISPSGTQMVLSWNAPNTQASLYKLIATDEMPRFELVGRFSPLHSPIERVVFSADESMMLLCEPSGNAALRSTTDGALLHTLRAGNFHIAAAGFVANDKRILTVSYDGSIRYWNLARPNPIGYKQGDYGIIVDEKKAVLTNGTTVYTCLLPALSPVPDSTSAGDCYPGVLISSTNGLLLGCTNGSVGMPGQWLPAAHNFGITTLAVSADGSRLLSADENGSAVLWDLPSRQSVLNFNPHNGKITDACFLPDGINFLTAGIKEGVKFWKADGSLTAQNLLNNQEVWALAVSSQKQNTVYCGTPSGKIYLLTPEGILKDSLLQKSPVNALAIDPKGRYLVSGDEEGTLRFWDSGTKRVFHLLQAPSDWGGISRLSVSPDGRWLLALSDRPDQPLLCWEYDNRKLNLLQNFNK